MPITLKRVLLVSFFFCILLIICIIFAVFVGGVDVPFLHTVKFLAGLGDDSLLHTILTVFRFPRILLAALTGASLGLCGLVFQTVLRNPLAEPFVLGVSGGAATGAVFSITILGTASIYIQMASAFCGAMLTLLLILAISVRKSSIENTNLILSGVMINSFFSAIIMYVMSTSDEVKVNNILSWLYGDLSTADFLPCIFILVPLVLFFIYLMYNAKEMNILLCGEPDALALGVDVKKFKLILLLCTTTLAGITVSITGLIGFVGIMLPHLIRMLAGYDNRILLPVCVLASASFMVCADTLSRTIISPEELPVGVITAAFGAPFFLIFLSGKGSKWL